VTKWHALPKTDPKTPKLKRINHVPAGTHCFFVRLWIDLSAFLEPTMAFPRPTRRVYIETYGCQMNVADSELVGGILDRGGYAVTADIADADLVLLNTCAIRENAEQRLHGRLGHIRGEKKRRPEIVVGVLGCMAERLRARFLDEEGLVDIVVGPDEYRRLPHLVEKAFAGEKGIAVRLSRAEDYDNIAPLRSDGVTAWIPVVRGCDKFCTFCVVPFTRGRERSRSLESIVREARELALHGFKEVTLLGQNVNSYRDGESDFADLIRRVAAVDLSLRVRFTTSHPTDMSDKLIETIARTGNICNSIHLPVQSGSDRILELMNRTYTVDHYLRLVGKIRSGIPGVSLSTDVISGFPGETLEEHRMTMQLMEAVQYDGAYTFKYSARANTRAWEMVDDVLEEEKGRRVSEITKLQHAISLRRNREMIGSVQRLLVEGPSKRSAEQYMGRTDSNKIVVFPRNGERPGQYVDVRIERVTSATLLGARA
jgi:tRNA-2-methylthio-N6-dimethylallyladenosine synthase